MAGQLTISTLSDGTNSTSATNCIQGSAKAWVNFNGTGTVAIRASYNVSSITDNGTGLYTVNFTNAFADANYCVSLAGAGNTANSDARQTIVMNGSTAGASVKTTTALQVLCGVTSSAVINDVAEVNVACFR
jgi:hypothetical protein